MFHSANDNPAVQAPNYLPDLIKGLEYNEISDEIISVAMSTAAVYNNSMDRLCYTSPSTSGTPVDDSRSARER